MPATDMPLEQLKTYQGASPCPADINAYWEDALAEMKAVEPRVELVQSKFSVPFAECFDLYFSGVRNARIHAKYLRPKESLKPHPAVLQFHGYTDNSGDWSDKLNFLAAGFSVAALDCRGQGGLSEDTGGVKGNTCRGHVIRGLDGNPEDMLFRHIFLDTAELALIIMNMPEVDPERVGAIGSSQGGALALVCGALEPRIKKLVSAYPFLCDYKRVYEMDLDTDSELKEYFRIFDPLHERENEIFNKLGHIDVQNIAGRIHGEVLMFVGLMDIICPPSTQYAAYNKIKTPKSTVIYPDFGHEPLPGFADKAFEFMMGL